VWGARWSVCTRKVIVQWQLNRLHLLLWVARPGGIEIVRKGCAGLLVAQCEPKVFSFSCFKGDERSQSGILLLGAR